MTNEPNGIGLAHIQRPEPARFAESDTDSDGAPWDEGQAPHYPKLAEDLRKVLGKVTNA